MLAMTDKHDGQRTRQKLALNQCAEDSIADYQVPMLQRNQDGTLWQVPAVHTHLLIFGMCVNHASFRAFTMHPQVFAGPVLAFEWTTSPNPEETPSTEECCHGCNQKGPLANQV